MTIRITKKREVEGPAEVVLRIPGPFEHEYQDATPDDLRAACAAVGLVVEPNLPPATSDPTEPRATDSATEEELVRVFYDARTRSYALGGHGGHVANERADHAGILALADRVRAERPACLVERAVKANVDIEVAEASLEYPGHRYIRVLPPKRELSANRNVPDAEAAATLEAMLTEVGA